MRSRTDVNSDQWQRTPFEFHRFLRFDRRSNQELDSCRRILEHNISVFGVNALFHDPTTLQSAYGQMLSSAPAGLIVQPIKTGPRPCTLLPTRLGSVRLRGRSRKAFRCNCRPPLKMSRFIRQSPASFSRFPQRFRWHCLTLPFFFRSKQAL